MAVTSTPRTTLDAVLRLISESIPGLTIQPGDNLHWSPKNNSVTYRAGDMSDENIWGLLHEAGHALLKHTNYRSDTELMIMEVAAWEAALQLASESGITLDDNHIQDCLDTYRDWLHQRSTCPRCGIVTFQQDKSTYRCYNCRKTWTVSTSRLCRPYRLSVSHKKNRQEHNSPAVFQMKTE